MIAKVLGKLLAVIFVFYEPSNCNSSWEDCKCGSNRADKLDNTRI